MSYLNLKPRLEGTQVYLRPLTESDATDDYSAWLNDPEVNRYLETRQSSSADLKKYIAEKSDSPDCLFFGIFVQSTDQHIGNVKLEPIDELNSYATLGLLIGDKDYWGKGVGTEVTQLLCDFVFNSLHLQEINLGVHGAHVAAIHVYEKNGFTEYKRDFDVKELGGKKYDQVWMKKLNNK